MTAYSEVRAHAYIDGEPVPITADDALRLVLDEGWAPYAAAEFVIPYSAARHAALDPHDAPRVVVEVARHWHGAFTLRELDILYAGVTLDDLDADLVGLTLDDLTSLWGWEWEAGWREPDVITADLGVRGRRTDYAAATITVRAASDELLVQDARVSTSRPVESLHQRILAVLALVGLTSPRYQFDAGAEFTSLTADTLALSQDPWSYLTGWCSGGSSPIRLWCDEQRVWRTAWADDPPSTTKALSRVKAATDDTDRDGEWCDAIVWVGKGTNSDGLPITDARTWPDPLPAGPIRVRVVEVDYGQQGAGLPMPTYEELAARLARLQSQDRVLDVVAVIDPTIRPGMALETGAPSLPALDTVASRVEFAVPADEVTITTRSTTEA